MDRNGLYESCGSIPREMTHQHSRRLAQRIPMLCVPRRGIGKSKSPNVPQRRLSEETAVFAIELAGTFVPDLEGRAGGVQTIHKHASSRGMQTELLLILKRTHGGQRPEMVMQRGHAHARDLRDLFHP